MSSIESLDEWLSKAPSVEIQAGERRELRRGLSIRKNVMNPFTVVTLRYEADPDKDPLTPQGKAWVTAQMRDMGCRRMCRECDKPWSVTDETCPECGFETELVLSNAWKKEYEIDYGAQSGSYVFDSFSRARNTCKPFRIPASWRRYRCIDHGVRNPTACSWIAVDPDGCAWLYAEHYEAGQTINYHARQIHMISALRDAHALEMTESALREMEVLSWVPSKEFIEKCARVYRTIGDPSMSNRTQLDVATVKQRYRENGIFIGDGNRATPGLETLNQMFSAGTFTIFETCHNAIREVENLVWEEHADPSRNKREKERDRDNHLVDTMKYFVNDFSPPSKEPQLQHLPHDAADAAAMRHREKFQERAKRTQTYLTNL